MSTKFWILGRLTEAVVTLVLTSKFYGLRYNRWIRILVAGGIPVIVVFFVLYNRGKFSLLVNDEKITWVLVSLEICVIAIFIMSLDKLKKTIGERGLVTYQYIFIALMLAVSAELNFIVFFGYTSFLYAYGHVLKIASYIFFFKGITISAITYPLEELMRTNEHNRNILDKLPSGLTFYDNDYRLSFANKKALEYFQCELDDVLGLSVGEVSEDVIKHVGEKDVFEISKDVFKHKSVRNVVQKYRNHKGTVYNLRIDSYELENGEYLYIFDDAKDQQLLQNLQLQTETILNSLTNLILICDVNDRIIACNSAFVNGLEVSTRDVVGLDWASFQEMLKFNAGTPHKEIRNNHLGVTREVSLTPASGNTKLLLLHSAPIYNVERELIGFIDVFSDITDLKKNQEKLIQQEKLALIGQLGAGVVHECKNYLTTIKGNNQLLGLTVKDERVQKYTQRIDGAVDEMNRIISDILTLAKPSQIVVSQVALGHVIKSMENILQGASFLQGVEVRITTGVERAVNCDENQIRQVILNMCKNAAEAVIEVEQPAIEIITDYDSVKNEAYIQISDNGKGIPDHILTKIGTPFFTTKETGTGLGLNICFQIVRENGGRIDIETEVGKGTTFKIAFPVMGTEKDELVPAERVV